MKKPLKIILLTLVSFFLPCSLWAAELKVVDPLGLIRAVSKIEESAKVTITLNSKTSNYPQSLQMVNLDGLAPAKNIQHSGNGLYAADALTPGTWEIKLKSPDINIKTVVIKP